MLLFITCSHVYMEIGVVVAGDEIDVATIIPEKWLRVKGHNILSDDSDDSEDSPSYEFVPRSSSYIDISKSEDSFPTNQEKES
ncbi:hypothetical protein WN944_029700 [Citrus x changshan-huyou]|uniref:Uncharacterized protein n=1 Tax=Citrus x changshan-huyou TaxID=2935761 RepID=A0AAP0LJG2_9ROSI